MLALDNMGGAGRPSPSPFVSVSRNPTMEGGMSKDDFLALLDTLVPAWSNMDNPMASDKSSTAESLAALTESGSMGHGVGNGPTYYSPRASGTPHGGTDAMSLDAREEIRLKNRECVGGCGTNAWILAGVWWCLMDLLMFLDTEPKRGTEQRRSDSSLHTTNDVRRYA